ncbi:MAG: hypothetical protein U0T83_09340 [Bacteriovoracaceae bacterium]
MNTNYLKGNCFEAQVSSSLKKQCIPILVSSKILRRNLSGQIDISYLDLHRKLIVVVECKSSLSVSNLQRKRLNRSANFLSEILRESVIIEYFIKNFLPKG